jgi:hypothetical protein
MKTLNQLLAILIILSQFCLAAMVKNEMVFCVQESGNIAIEPSINGICVDSKSLSSQNSKSEFLQLEQLPAKPECRDISIGHSFFYTETKRDSYKTHFKNPVLYLISTIPTNQIVSGTLFGEAKHSPDNTSNTPYSRRTVVLLI